MMVRSISEAAAKEFGVEVADMHGSGKGKDVVEARNVAFYVSSRLTLHNRRKIGELLSKAPGQVHIGIAVVKVRIEQCAAFEQRVRRVEDLAVSVNAQLIAAIKSNRIQLAIRPIQVAERIKRVRQRGAVDASVAEICALAECLLEFLAIIDNTAEFIAELEGTGMDIALLFPPGGNDAAADLAGQLATIRNMIAQVGILSIAPITRSQSNG